MRQLMLGFGSEWELEIPIPFDPELQEQLVVWMAQAVLAVVDDVRQETQGGCDDADAIEQ